RPDSRIRGRERYGCPVTPEQLGYPPLRTALWRGYDRDRVHNLLDTIVGELEAGRRVADTATAANSLKIASWGYSKDDVHWLLDQFQSTSQPAAPTIQNDRNHHNHRNSRGRLISQVAAILALASLIGAVAGPAALATTL